MINLYYEMETPVKEPRCLPQSRLCAKSSAEMRINMDHQQGIARMYDKYGTLSGMDKEAAKPGEG